MVGRVAACLLALHCLSWLDASYLPFSHVVNEEGGYCNVLVAFSPDSEARNHHGCALIEQVKALFRNASAILYAATQHHTYFKNVTILIPDGWDCPDAQATPATWEAFDEADVRVEEGQAEPFTVQPLACGQPGLYIRWTAKYLHEALLKQALSLVREWAHLRFGIFEEFGLPGTIFPPFYYDDAGELLINACTNKEPQGVYLNQLSESYCEYDASGVPDADCVFVPSHEEAEGVTSSLASLPVFPTVNAFCNATSHNERAPNKHNFLCDGKSTWDVISRHDDLQAPNAFFADPEFKVVRHKGGCVARGNELRCEIASFVTVAAFGVFQESKNVTLLVWGEKNTSIRNIVIKYPNGTTDPSSQSQTNQQIAQNKENNVSIDYTLLEVGRYEISILHRLNDIIQPTPVFIHVAILHSSNDAVFFMLQKPRIASFPELRLSVFSFVSAASLEIAPNTDFMTVSFQFENRSSIRNIMLKRPDGKNTFLSPLSNSDVCTPTEDPAKHQVAFYCPGPQPGVYKMAILHRRHSNQTISVSIRFSSWPPTFAINCWVTPSQIVGDAPQRFIILAHVQRRGVQNGSSVESAPAVTALVRDGRSNCLHVGLRDKGADPDISAGDGVYSRYLPTSLEPGTHEIYVDNNVVEQPGPPTCHLTSPSSYQADDPTDSTYCGTVTVPEKQEAYPPGRVTDLSGRHLEAQNIELSWTAPGNFLDVGTVHFYEVLVSTTWPGNLQQNLTRFAMPDLIAAGERATYPLQVPLGDIWYVRLRAVNEAGLAAPFSNIAQVLSYQP